MIRPRVLGRLRRTGVPFALLTALSESDGSVPLQVFHTILFNLVNSDASARGTKGQMFADGLLEIRVHITPAGLDLLEKNQPGKKQPCAKRAPTAGRKATAPTAAPIDSTPLAMAWMGRR